MVDPFFTTRTPVTDLSVYLELINQLPSIEEGFFRLPLFEEKRKLAIYSCLKTSYMNYNPPPQNYSASSTIKKLDSTFYGIQNTSNRIGSAPETGILRPTVCHNEEDWGSKTSFRSNKV
ncbi:hypothetical protein AYI68_g6913 [Smittium mucronatum]|uniref:Uncharacterized protein n=1 Tax=Smittium mucronatum TaxID=133383 RepID=A0A1R0GQ99_9FUNG|nr:hypothetical protein AYI68_g6913 [Smittium mucronatum]